jgi:hypothetical protein
MDAPFGRFCYYHQKKHDGLFERSYHTKESLLDRAMREWGIGKFHILEK